MLEFFHNFIYDQYTFCYTLVVIVFICLLGYAIYQIPEYLQDGDDAE